MKKEVYTCDINGCNNQGNKTEINTGKKVQVIFTTEQTEGRSTSPYLEIDNIDICPSCLEILIKEGRYIHADGAQGHNKYYF